jgi:GDP-L-fucose synthase
VKFLVAGATGLAGSAIMRALNLKGIESIGISSANLNLLDRKATFDYLREEKPDIVIDAAARVGGIGANSEMPVQFISENLQIQVNLMDAAHQADVSKFVFLGSACIYPKICEQPIREESLLTGLLEPTNSAYAVAKIAGLETINAYRKQYRRRWISVMPTNLYGPNDNFDENSGHVLPSLIAKFERARRESSSQVVLWGSGNPRREFLHADDLAEAILLCVKNYDSSMPINVGIGEDLTIRELSQLVASESGFSGEVVWDREKPDGTPRRVLEVSRIKHLGWRPRIELREGIASTIKWYRENLVKSKSE